MWGQEWWDKDDVLLGILFLVITVLLYGQQSEWMYNVKPAGVGPPSDPHGKRINFWCFSAFGHLVLQNFVLDSGRMLLKSRQRL